MRMRYLIFIFMLLITVQIVQAQSDEGACPEFVQQAITEIGDSCNGLDRNSVCYGFNRVDATFVEDTLAGSFSQPSDRAGLVELEKITTAPLDALLNQWGIAVMNVQANVPSSLPGQAVTFMLLGDTEVENAVAPGDVLPDSQTITVTTTVETALFTGPGNNTNIRRIVPAGTALPAVGLSEDRAWLRLALVDGTAFVDRNAVDPILDISSLPTASGDAPSPMQSFYFRTSFNDLECDEAPSILAIQSPEGIKVDLTANGAHIQLGSLIMLRVIPPGNAMQVITLEGEATLEPGTPDEVHVPAGKTTQRCLSEPEELGISEDNNDQTIFDECKWLLPVLLDEEEQQLGQIVLQAFQSFVQTGGCTPGQSLTHIVSTGETLFSIGQRYGASVGAIATANNLTTPNIFAGQQLSVTCGAQEPRNFVFQPPGIVTEEPVFTGVDCTPFQATSPLDGLPYGNATFFWNPAPGATSYRVNISGESGAFSFAAPGSASSLTINVTNEGIGFGFSFTWNVDALLNGQVVCSSSRVTIPREPAPEPPDPQPTPTIDPRSQEQKDCEANGGIWRDNGEGGYYCDFGTLNAANNSK
jgi:LysM domain